MLYDETVLNEPNEDSIDLLQCFVRVNSLVVLQQFYVFI